MNLCPTALSFWLDAGVLLLRYILIGWTTQAEALCARVHLRRPVLRSRRRRQRRQRQRRGGGTGTGTSDGVGDDVGGGDVHTTINQPTNQPTRPGNDSGCFSRWSIELWYHSFSWRSLAIKIFLVPTWDGTIVDMCRCLGQQYGRWWRLYPPHTYMPTEIVINHNLNINNLHR